MNKNSKARFKLAQKNARNGQRSTTFDRPSPYSSITITIAAENKNDRKRKKQEAKE